MARWTKSHPERTPNHPIDQYTHEEMGIFLADAVADDTIQEKCDAKGLPRVKRSNIPIKDVLPYLIPLNQWHICNALRPQEVLLRPISDYVNEARLARYLEQRDLYRVRDGRPAYWATTDIAMASRCAPVPHNTATRRLYSSIIYDKIVHGRNKAKETKNIEDARCPHCGVGDSAAHIILQCQQASLLPIRSKGKAQWHKLVHSPNQRSPSLRDPLSQPWIWQLGSLTLPT